MKRIALVIAAAAVTFFAQPAQAAVDPYKDRPTRVVRIADLDLTNPEDQNELRIRVGRAARHICAGEATRIARRKCAAETIDYTMSIVPMGVRRAYAAATDRQRSFALAGN